MNTKTILDVVKKLILFSAITHLVLLGIHALMTLDITRINYFDILDLDLFIPSIAEGTASQWISFATVLIISWIIFKFFPNKK